MKTKKITITLTALLLFILASCASNAPRNVNYKRNRGRCGSCTKWSQNVNPSADKTTEMAFVDPER